jgi:mannosyltransferase OCH1-like enzyme
LYNVNYLNYNGDYAPRIPKILHYLWLEGDLPTNNNELIKIWKSNHPTWEFRFWNNETLKNFKFENQELYDKASNLFLKSFIARTEILYRFGGVYSDTDVINFKPLDDLLYLKFFGGYHYVHDGLVSPDDMNYGVIGSVPNNEMIQNIIHNTKMIDPSSDMSDKILTQVNTELTVIFPPSFLFPFPTNAYYPQKHNIGDVLNTIWQATHPESYTAKLHYFR